MSNRSSKTKTIYAWIGYSDGKPYIFRNEHGQREWCVFTNRAHAREAFEDVRRCKVVIEERK